MHKDHLMRNADEMANVQQRVRSYGKNMFTIPGTCIPSTFFGTDMQEEWRDIDIALIGIPSDVGLTCRPGARHGPQAVRTQSSFIGHRNLASNVIPYELACIRDRGNVPLEKRLNLDATIHEITAFYEGAYRAGVVPISVGGDHSVTYPILNVLGRSQPVGLIHIDAHTDTYGPLYGVHYHHGTPFYHSLLEGLVDPERMVQIALRDPYIDFSLLSPHAGITLLPMEECQRVGIAQIATLTREVIGNGPVYISFDIDALDPAFAPGTGTPVVGGLSTREALQLLQGFRGLDVIGADLVEVSPPYDPNGTTALVGAQLLFELLCLVAEAHRERQAQ